MMETWGQKSVHFVIGDINILPQAADDN